MSCVSTMDKDFVDAINEVQRYPYYPTSSQALYKGVGAFGGQVCEEMNDSVCPELQTSNQVLAIMLQNDKAGAVDLTSELQDMRQILEEEGDAESSRFLKVLQVRRSARQLIQPCLVTRHQIHLQTPCYPLVYDALITCIRSCRACFSTPC